MSYTNTTPNYGLPQYLSSDKPAWMADINVAFSDIDTQMKQNADDSIAAQTTANNALLDIATGYSNLSTYSVGDLVIYQERLYICDVAVTVPEAFDNAKWSIYRVVDIADVADLAKDTADAVDSKVGNTDISGIGDGTCTGAIDALDAILSETNKLLWTNPVPSAAFAPQTVNINLTDYDAVDITFDRVEGSSCQDTFRMVKNGAMMIASIPWDNNTVGMRVVNSCTNTGVDFGKGVSHLGADNNTCMIPLQIVGIKYN